MSNRDDIDENRRRINRLTGAGIVTTLTAGAGGLIAYLDAKSKPEQGRKEGNGATTDPQGYSPGELYDWDSVGKCLSTDQKESVTEVVEEYESPKENLRYSIETDGNVIIHAPDEDVYKPIAETTDNDFMCEINY